MTDIPLKEEKKEVIKPKSEKNIWNSWVKENKNKIKDNSSYRVIGKFRYIFLIFIMALFLILVVLAGMFFIIKTGDFKSIVNNTNLCSCPTLPSIPTCPSAPACNCPNCPSPVCNNNCSVSVPNNLNVYVRNTTG